MIANDAIDLTFIVRIAKFCREGRYIHERGVLIYDISAICQTGAKKPWQCYFFFIDKLKWQN